MFSLFKKEISTFFCSITGYLVVLVFLVATGLFLWVVPSETNILYGGYSTLEPLFVIAPWIYLFLVPAVAMRLIAEERKTGTLELLLIRPLSPMQIVVAKYFAGLSVVFISIIPTLVYLFVVYQLGAEKGNFDIGAAAGSYIGLLFLAAIYMAVSLFASSITDNQIVAFVVGVVLCFAFYSGFDSLSSVFSSGVGSSIASLGIANHYSSISRGVLDSRDVVYFLSVAFVFIYFTRLIIGLRK